jgi:Flp pilus assembly protein TadG
MSLFRRVRRDQRGAAAVEFALIAPVMVFIYFGLVEVCEAVLAERKANHVASEVGDLAAQATTLSASDVSDIFSLGGSVLAPFSSTNLQMRISSLSPNASSQLAVVWSCGSGMSKLAVGTVKTIPISVSSGDSIILSEVTYTFNSPLRYALPNGLTYRETFYLRPRQVQQIPDPGC